MSDNLEGANDIQGMSISPIDDDEPVSTKHETLIFLCYSMLITKEGRCGVQEFRALLAVQSRRCTFPH